MKVECSIVSSFFHLCVYILPRSSCSLLVYHHVLCSHVVPCCYPSCHPWSLVEQRVQDKDCDPMHITHPCLQWAYGRNWSIRHAGSPVKDPCQVKEMVYSSFWIHPWPVDCKTPGWRTRGTVTYWTRKQCLKRFCLVVAHSLTQVNKPAFKIGWGSSSPPPPLKKEYTPRPAQPKPQLDVLYDNCGHWPLHCYKQGRCMMQFFPLLKWKPAILW